ncbi:MAG: putative selenium-dependent hydroxylase accessory protein YqeC, partial [Peptococcaceae bacterium]|nr:putative selenium-dependent hydroxylase accessory protein YqeC [Peptococcaceae bacterium]
MPKLTDMIAIREKETVAFVGSGGKTALMWLLADHYRQSKTLVTTTTKIFYDRDRHFEDFRDSRSLLSLPIVRGVTLAGEVLHGEESGKLGGLNPESLEKGKELFDRVFIEGDGSRRLPLKGWADHEPVVPWFTGCTIGVITLWSVGMPINESIIFRLPVFCEISGAKEGDALTIAHVAAAIAHPRGLWKGSRGRRILFINQVEDLSG